MALSASGIGSGLDVESIVQQLMQIEQRPLTLLAQREASFQARLTTFGALKSAIASFQTAAQTLADLSIGYRASSSDTAALGVSASTTATAATYGVDVTRLAQGQTLIAAGQAAPDTAIGDGASRTVTITKGTITGGTLANGIYSGATFTADPAATPVNLVIDSTNNTLEGIRDAINAAEASVTATIVNDGGAAPYRLALSSTGIGAASSAQIAVSGGIDSNPIADLLAYDPAGTQHLVQTRAAQDATLTIDSIPITRPGNSVADAIEGVTLTLKAPTASTAIVEVVQDTTAARGAVQSFVKAYNDLGRALADATGKGRQLQGDASVLGFQQRLRTALGGSYGSTGGGYPNLSALGVTFQLEGTLAFDSTRLAAALDADPAAVLTTLAGAGSALKAQANAALGAGGVIDAGTDRLNASIESIAERRSVVQRRLQDTEARYRKQFTALDVMLASMSQTSAFLQAQLAQLPSPTQSSGR